MENMFFYVNPREVLFSGGIPLLNDYTEFVALQMPSSWSWYNFAIL